MRKPKATTNEDPLNQVVLPIQTTTNSTSPSNASQEEAVQLLQEIFPSADRKQLYRLHQRRLKRNTTRTTPESLQASAWNQYLLANKQQQARHTTSARPALYTQPLHRQPHSSSLGLTLCQDNDLFRVHSLGHHHYQGSTQIHPRDILFGVQGRSVHGMSMPQVVSLIQSTPDPVLFHLLQDDPGPPRYVLTPSPAPQGQAPTVTTTLPSAPLTTSTPAVLPIPHPFVAHFVSHKCHSSPRHPSRLRNLHQQLAQFHQKIQDEETCTLQQRLPLLSIRIVHSFLARETHTTTTTERAYSIWIHNLITRQEFYAPVRYEHDFQELQQALQWKPQQPKTTILRQWELLLRRAWTHLRFQHDRNEKHVYLESFLGMEDPTTIVEKQSSSTLLPNEDDNEQTQSLLRYSFQKYTYRILSLSLVSDWIESFIDTILQSVPLEKEALESMQANGEIKPQAHDTMRRIQHFLDSLQKMVVQYCHDDFQSIALADDYSRLHPILFRCDGEFSTHGRTIFDKLVREAVREQIEVEVYVPLRNVVSKLLVHGWRHEDMECHYKMKELRKKSPSYFGIPSQHNWEKVSQILHKGVSQSTLPCLKLRAIVEAAKEISKILVEEVQDTASMSADVFLPIFVYCVVQSNLERPFALSVLLQSLCDPLQIIGEVGYYVASFEAAIAHIQEIDLSTDDITLHKSSFSLDE